LDNKVYIYTDGACINNPGPGGIGIVMKYRDNKREISKGYRCTTNKPDGTPRRDPGIVPHLKRKGLK